MCHPCLPSMHASYPLLPLDSVTRPSLSCVYTSSLLPYGLNSYLLLVGVCVTYPQFPGGHTSCHL
jgi:hypothetical protein